MKRSAVLGILIVALSLVTWLGGSAPSQALKDPCPPTGGCRCDYMEGWPCAPEGAIRRCFYPPNIPSSCTCLSDSFGVERWTCA